MKRVTHVKRAGITPGAPFWSGSTAEKILDERRAAYQAAALAKRTRKPGSSGRVLTPARQLTRLMRALGRRKTLEARQRVAARIAELKTQLGID